MHRHTIAAPATFLAGMALALSACTAPDATSGGVGSAEQPASSLPAAGGPMRGNSFAMMAEQYAPRAGNVAATGASAWVRPAPAPAFVASGPPPPADPPAPLPAAVANRQPGTPAAPPATPVSEIARPEAAAPESSAVAAANAAMRIAGLALFNTYSCSACHALADAGAAGSVGPSLDGNPRLSRALAVDVISDGRGPMPAFAGQMSQAEIGVLADYLVAFSRK